MWARKAQQHSVSLLRTQNDAVHTLPTKITFSLHSLSHPKTKPNCIIKTIKLLLFIIYLYLIIFVFPSSSSFHFKFEPTKSQVWFKMAEQGNRWSWDVAGFDPWKSSPSSQSPPTPLEHADRKPTAPLVRRYSISATSVLPQPRQSVALKLQRLKDKVKVMRFRLHFWLCCYFLFFSFFFFATATFWPLPFSSRFGNYSTGFTFCLVASAFNDDVLACVSTFTSCVVVSTSSFSLRRKGRCNACGVWRLCKIST